MESMGQEEKDRVAKQREQLGEEGLDEKGDILEKATDENEVLYGQSSGFICAHKRSLVHLSRRLKCTILALFVVNFSHFRFLL